MVYLYYHQKMLKRKSSTIPFGYKLSENKKYLESIEEELDALEQAKEYLKNCSYREVAHWLFKKTGRYISHVGLRKLNKKWQTLNPQNLKQIVEESGEIDILP